MIFWSAVTCHRFGLKESAHKAARSKLTPVTIKPPSIHDQHVGGVRTG
jgi:hypothetical protein